MFVRPADITMAAIQTISPELRQEGSQPLEDLQDSLRLKESNAFNNLTNTLYFRGYLEINKRK